jgi:hypothetical protein
MPRAQPAILAFTATWLLANMVSRIPLGVGRGRSQHEAYPALIGGLIGHVHPPSDPHAAHSIASC